MSVADSFFCIWAMLPPSFILKRYLVIAEATVRVRFVLTRVAAAKS